MKAKAFLLSFMLMFAIGSYGQSGQVGNLSWNITDDVLTISGTGAMSDIGYKSHWRIYGYYDRIRKVVIENGVTSIGNEAFREFRSLTRVEMPGSVTSIGDNAFNNCSELINIKLPDNLVSIGSNAFEFCSKLTSIDIPNSVTSIGSGAFNECFELRSVKLPENITVLKNSVFESCYSLTNVKIPNSVVGIGGMVFYQCYDLATVDVYWENPINISFMEMSYIFDHYENVINLTLVVPAGTKTLYENATVWGNFKTITERVSAPVTSVSLFPNNSANLVVGSSLQLTATVSPENATDKSLTWRSNNKMVATVDSSGKITALAPGSAKITVTTNNEGKTAIFDVTVFEIPATSVIMDITEDSIQIGETLQLTATVNPSYSSNVTWSSGNESVATVDHIGRVTGISEGSTTIIAATNNGLIDSCAVTVYKLVNNVLVELPLEGGGESIFFTLVELPERDYIKKVFFLRLPEGMVIDPDNTNVTGLPDGMELTIKPLGNNSWVITIVYI